MNFNEANKVEHPVEGEWHYPIMIDAGFKPITLMGIGLVRSYEYEKNNHKILVATGVNADYWRDEQNNKGGYWMDLKGYVNAL
jgi:hypothetical protein